jgi:signal transduction histidine kinase
MRGSNVGYRSGLGVGLYVVKQAIDRHHGTLNVSSEEGRGSTFTVKLPR